MSTDSGSQTHAGVRQSDRVSSRGRCPCLVDIDRGVEIALVHSVTVDTGPDAIPQRDGIVEMPADMTTFGGREPLVDVLHNRATLLCRVVQDAHKTGKAQVRHFAAPQRFHPLEIERLQPYSVILLAQLAG